MLTKFAMIFFILSLAYVVMTFTETEKKGLCSVQAGALASSLSSTLINVINSPAEDERKVYPLESVISFGGDDGVHYTPKLILRPASDSTDTGSIVVEVLTGGNCEGGSNAPYSKVKVHILSSEKDKAGNEYLLMHPSEKDAAKKTQYLVLIKCQPKKLHVPEQLFVYDCKDPDPETCMNFLSTTIDYCCGWGCRKKVGDKCETTPSCSDTGLGTCPGLDASCLPSTEATTP